MDVEQEFLPPQRPPRKPGQEPTARLTLEAYRRMRKELEQLKGDGRRAMSERLLRAREFGDIRENAEYDTAKNDQALMESRIRDLEQKLRDPEILEVSDDVDEVTPGVVVTLRPTNGDGGADPEDDEAYLVALAAEERAPGVRTVTAASPLGSALLGRRVGERVTYEAPGGSFTYEVVSLRPHRP